MSISRRLEDARFVFDEKISVPLHEISEIHKGAEEQHVLNSAKYIGSMVFGRLDGIMTTFAVVSGVAGAQLNPVIIIIRGLANLFGDGFSMSLGLALPT